MILEKLKDRVLILDGAMGTEIIKRIGKDFEFPELLNIERREMILEIHREYIEAGADIIETNTFGANRVKLSEYGAGDRVEEFNIAAAKIAREASERKDVLVAGSMGPLGKLIRPLGELKPEEVYRVYSEQAKALEKGGVDFILIETQIDILEAKIALVASRDSTSLPVAVSMAYPLEGGRTVTGSDAEIASITFASTGADIFGVNCGGDPAEYGELIEKVLHYSDKPLIVYANAGVPEKSGDEIVYSLGPEEYAEYAMRFYELGASIIGGCCGTSTEHIKLVSERLKGKNPPAKKRKDYFFSASSRNSSLLVDGSLPFRIIGENINPFGRKKLSKEIGEGRLELVRRYAREQERAGADALDINLGNKGEKSPEFFSSAIGELQSTTKLPLFLDNSNPEAIELALLSYAGKAVINSVNGERSSYETLLPLARKYGAAVVLLAMDEGGIPDNAGDRVRIIETLYRAAIDYGLKGRDILADPVVLTISGSQHAAMETLKAIEMIRAIGLRTVIGLSNISFGLPQRRLLNKSFLSMAMERGLDSAILNPLDEELISIARASDALLSRDRGMRFYIGRFGGKEEVEVEEVKGRKPENPEEELYDAVIDGEGEKAEELARVLVEEGKDGLLSPALKKVGEYYEKRIYFLPQLILSAEAMERASKVIAPAIGARGRVKKKLRIVIATVKGDLHDIGKNIVSLVLRNYGYDVIDLGKNVKAEDMVEAAVKEKADFIGASALMTTTMDEMARLVELRNSRVPRVKVIIGGAAVSRSFAEEIGADAYCRDAMDAVRKVEELSGDSR